MILRLGFFFFYTGEEIWKEVLGHRGRQTYRKSRSLFYWTKPNEPGTSPALPDMSDFKKDTLTLGRMQRKEIARRFEDC